MARIKTLSIVIAISLILVTLPQSNAFDDDDEVIQEFVDQNTSGNMSLQTSELSASKVNSEESLGQESKEVAPEEQKIASISSETPVAAKEPCSCVKYYLCDVEDTNKTVQGATQEISGLGLIDIRLGSSKPSPCKHYFDICCKSRVQEKPAERIPSSVEEEADCGKRNTKGVGFRITGALDNEAQFGEFPWMAAIVKKESQGPDKPPLNIFVCGGSLINTKVILTAAHCVFGKLSSELKVRLGEWDTQTVEELYPHQDRNVTKIIIHEDFYMGALYNDVALLFLDTPVVIAPNVDTICLPPSNINFDGQRCFASGWGKDSFEKEGKYQVILKRVEVPVVPREKCEAALRTTRLGPYFKLDSSFVCAGGEPGKDTCRGDGGSPLVCQLPNSQSYAQFGIVAWGIGCGERDIPGVYANIPKFVTWIESKLKAAKLDTSSYKSSR